MFLQEFPDLNWLKHEATKKFGTGKDWKGRPLPHAGWSSVVLNVKTNQTFRDHIVGPVSLFGNLSGASLVTVDNRKVLVPAGYFFISNEEQEYILEIDSKETETFNIHFGRHFVAQAFQSLVGNDIEQNNKLKTPDFKNRLFPFDDQIKGLIRKLKNNGNEMTEQEVLYDLFCYVLKKEQTLIKVSEGLPVTKKSTRDEVMKEAVN